MFSSLDQPRIVAVCLFIGVIIGVFYEPFYFLKLIFKHNIIGQILNGLWLFLSSFIYIFISTIYNFPNFRGYILIFIILGCLIYLFSFHKIIAIFENKVYNILIKIFKRVKTLYDRPKEKKGFFRRVVGTNNAYNDTRFNNSVSISGHFRKKKTNRTSR